MAQIANDIPKGLLEMLDAIDYSKITDEHYRKWIEAIKANIGKHVKKRTKPAKLMNISYPISQELCDIISEYDFNSIPFAKRLTLMPTIKLWAGNNLPLIKTLN